MAAVCAVTAAVLWALILVFSWSPAPAWPSPPAASRGQASAEPVPSSPAPASIPSAAIVDPRLVTLRLSDLPPGYHILREGAAAFASIEAPAPASWDVVFAPDAGSGAQYLLVESLVAIYPDAGAAAGAIEAEDAAERAAHAVQQAAVAGLGDRQTVWIERAPDRPSYGIVRVTWQSRTAVEQLSILGPVGPDQPGQTLQLAAVQQSHANA